MDVPTIPPAPLVEELPEVIKRDETVPNNPENPSPQTMEEYEPLDCSGPHFQTSVALLRDPNSAFHDAPEKIINRIVATVAR